MEMFETKVSKGIISTYFKKMRDENRILQVTLITYILPCYCTLSTFLSRYNYGTNIR